MELGVGLELVAEHVDVAHLIPVRRRRMGHAWLGVGVGVGVGLGVGFGFGVAVGLGLGLGLRLGLGLGLGLELAAYGMPHGRRTPG